MLIGQNPHTAAGAQQIDYRLKSLLAIEQFQASEMTQNEHDRNASAKFPVHRLDIVNRNAPEDFLRRHRGEFNATEKVSAESLEMAADKPTHFLRILFIGKCNGNIAVRQASIFPGNEPGTNTEKLSNGKQKAHWYCGGNR